MLTVYDRLQRSLHTTGRDGSWQIAISAGLEPRAVFARSLTTVVFIIIIGFIKCSVAHKTRK